MVVSLHGGQRIQLIVKRRERAFPPKSACIRYTFLLSARIYGKEKKKQEELRMRLEPARKNRQRENDEMSNKRMYECVYVDIPDDHNNDPRIFQARPRFSFSSYLLLSSLFFHTRQQCCPVENTFHDKNTASLIAAREPRVKRRGSRTATRTTTSTTPRVLSLSKTMETKTLSSSSRKILFPR